MEFFIGSVFTLITVVVVNLLVRSQLKQNKDKTIIRYSQSHIHNLVKPFLPQSNFMKPIKQSQAIKHKQSQFMRVMVLDGKAYWIKDQALYTAEVSDGKVNQDTAQKVDTIAMSKVELDKVIFVVEQLTDGSENDFGNPGKSIF
jgi:hypothetical protein